MTEHEIVASIMDGEKDAISTVITGDIICDQLPDDPRIYLSFNLNDSDVIISFPLKELYRCVEKAILR